MRWIGDCKVVVDRISQSDWMRSNCRVGASHASFDFKMQVIVRIHEESSIRGKPLFTGTVLKAAVQFLSLYLVPYYL